MRGVVKWFNDAKGFGFIAPEGGGADVFVHRSALDKCGMSGLATGDQVEYELRPSPKSGKMAAANLKLIKAAA